VAAVDLGSNSFHMVVARMVNGQPILVDRLRERVALAEGLDDKKRLTPGMQAKALEAMHRFGQRLRDMPRGSVRAVGTNTLRQARNTRAFLVRARRALGHPIEVISGREEARLIYGGVAHSLADDPGKRLVVDIGGGSTECIIGERFEPLATDSLYMGCVTFSLRFFPKGEIGRKRMDEAVIAAQREVAPLEQHYRALGWERAVGASGTILAIESILRAKGWSERGITAGGLRKLRKVVVDARRTQALHFPGMPAERAGVLPGGLAILIAIFESLQIERMSITTGSLREGLLYDLLGRMRHEDARERTIRQFTQRYHVDNEQAGRVEHTALACLEQVARRWGLRDPEHRRLLTWAARVHEMGLSVNYSGYHKHGAYIAEHADMPGFSREDQQVLAALVGGHRRKLPMEVFRELPPARSRDALALCVLLRLAVTLNRIRSAREVPAPRLSAQGHRLRLRFPRGWLRQHPLTRADLDEEAALLRTAGVRLQVS